MSSAATIYQSLNLIAITCAALAGSTAARRRGLDPVGVLCCAFISGLGGGLLRDILLQDGVLASIANTWNPAVAFAAGAVVCFASPRGVAWRILAPVAEAATIGAWAVTGTEKAATLGIAPFSAVLLGVVSAVGGGAVRDVVVLRRIPEIFGGNTLTATCAASSALVMITAYRLHYPGAGLACGTAIGGVLYLVARRRHWVLPPAVRLHAETPGGASAASTEPARPAEREHSDAATRG
ncbi:MAG: TRIC cation channel family protein [Streptosporangiaceae bacterium]